MSVTLYPFLNPTARPLQSLAGRTPIDPAHSLPVGHPVKLKAQEAKAALHVRMESAEAQYPGLVRRNLKIELLQSLR
jgi:hypothetical protein